MISGPISRRLTATDSITLFRRLLYIYAVRFPAGGQAAEARAPRDAAPIDDYITT